VVRFAIRLFAALARPPNVAKSTQLTAARDGTMGKESLYNRALRNTGYYRIGMMTQDLIWEQYRYPIPLSGLLQGKLGPSGIRRNPVVKIYPPSRPKIDVVIDKTGSTSGLGAYMAFILRRRRGSFCSQTNRIRLRRGSRPPIVS